MPQFAVIVTRHRRASAGQGWNAGHATVPVAETVATPGAVARRLARSPPPCGWATDTTSTMAELLTGSPHLSAALKRTWTTTPTRVLTSHPVRSVTTTSALGTTPHGGSAELPVVVVVGVVGRADGDDLPQETTVAAASTVNARSTVFAPRKDSEPPSPAPDV
ncbi:MAG: hypothetical protein ACYDD6_10140 [Acidimicrobiales bacterium]